MYQRSQRSHDKTIFQVILIISAVSVVNDEIIFNVVLLVLGMYSSSIHETGEIIFYVL